MGEKLLSRHKLSDGWSGSGGRDGLVQPRPADLVQDNEQRTLTNRKQWG